MQRSPSRARTTTLAAVLTVALATSMATASPASARSGHDGRHAPRLEPRTHFTMQPDGSSGLRQDGEGIPNIDSVKSTIRAYYGAGTDGIANMTASPYISEMKRIAHAQWRYLARAKRTATKHHRRPAIVFDADDTTLWTYDMEDGRMHFVFDPKVQNDEWVQPQKFPATPSMVGFVNRAKKAGFAIFGITGRSDTQEEATLGNLAKVGYTPFNAENFYTKWSGTNPKPAYVTCATTSCTTVEYKAGTRKHIEKDLGYDIVLNVGDQWSDLQGGYADRVLKLPNPTYNLPSPDLDGTPADRAFSPRSRFEMLPDGSSGLTEGGEGIPNIDIVKTTIRTYYKATAGIADKSDSPYIREMARITRRLTPRLVDACRTADRRHQDPVVVLDADDTTLWTYDMEDGAMKFVFSPTVQNDDWVQPQKFPATPGMVALTKAVDNAGCTLVGLTGRNDSQKSATLGNLAKVGYTGFTSQNYYTKWVSGTIPSGRPWLAGTPCEDGVCTTIEYKSLTRKHVAAQGHRIVASLGDQFSDLIGGYGAPVKLPNPTYYLP
jgi:predicted secreted acid phosphatase